MAVTPRLTRAAALALAAAVALPVAAAAQVDGEAPPGPIGARVELGGGGGLMVAYPEVGALVSMPIGRRVSFDLAASWLPRIIYEREHGLVQGQLRIPFRAHLRSRRSLLLGVTRVSTRKRRPFDGGFWGQDATIVFPHAGASLQWPVSRNVDLRLDTQGLITLDSELPLVARVAAALVWHPGGAR